MPNRILKESIRTSKKIGQLSDFQFRVWAYLITYVDDFGRGSADPELLKGLVFPRCKRLSESAIEDALVSLARLGCIQCYKVAGESYLCFPNWGEHQRIQKKYSKFPEPPTDFGTSPQFTVNHGESPPESNPIQSNPESRTSIQNPESNPPPATAADKSSDPELGEVMSAYMDALGVLSTTAVAEIQAFYRDFGKAVMLSVLSKSIDNGVLKWAYSRSILRSYKAAGTMTPEQITAAEIEHEASKQAPFQKRPGRNAPAACTGYKPIDMAALKAISEKM